MKKTLLLIFVFISFLVSCKTPEQTNPNNNIYKIEFVNEMMTIDTYESKELLFNTDADLSLVSFISSNESIVKVVNNMIVPVSAGTATITAKIQDGATDEMVVTVNDDGSVPYLDVDKTDVTIFENSFYQIKSSVLLREEYIEVNYTYTSNDPSIATVDEMGKVSAVKSGETTIDIVAEYDEYSGNEYNSLRRTINVTVEKEVIMIIESKDSTIYCRNDIIEGVEYSNETTLSGHIYFNNEYTDIFDASVEWISSNPNILTIENGKIIGNQSGQANIYAQKVIDGVIYTSNQLMITVDKPTFNINNSPVLVDLSTKLVTLSTDFMFGDDNEIINIYDQENPFLSIYDGNTLVNYDKFGPRKWIIESSMNKYVIDVISCNKIIKTKEELLVMHTYGNVIKKGSSGIIAYDGYYILGNDIDMSGTNFRTSCGITTGAVSVKTDGFMGVFDGHGHTIMNANVTSTNGGLFGTLNEVAVVRNVAFINATVGGRSGLITSNCGGTIENVYVEGKITFRFADKDNTSSLLASKIYKSSNINCCIVNFTNATDDNNFAAAIGNLVTANENNFKNVFVLGTDSKVFSTETSNKFNTFKSADNGQFLNYQSLLSKDLSKFNSFWIFDDAGISFSSSH